MLLLFFLCPFCCIRWLDGGLIGLGGGLVFVGFLCPLRVIGFPSLFALCSVCDCIVSLRLWILFPSSLPRVPPVGLIPPLFHPPHPIISIQSKPSLIPLVLACSISTLACYIFLLIPPAILPSPLFSVICFAFGYGPAPLLLVIIAPFLTEHVSLALGVHKALEMAGSTIMQMV